MDQKWWNDDDGVLLLWVEGRGEKRCI